MHCINSDYPAFRYCEKVATSTLYFMGGAKQYLCTFGSPKNIFLFHTNVRTFNQSSNICFLSLDTVLNAPEKP